MDVQSFLHASGLFDARWYLSQHGRDLASDADPMQHYLANGLPAGLAPCAWLEIPGAGSIADTADATEPSATDAGVAFLGASGLFDAEYYLRHNQDVAAAGTDPLLHFCRHGWTELRNPSADFDTWWYWSRYLDPGRAAVNPLLHFALIGKARAYIGKPVPPPQPEGMSYAGRSPSRICLFAGYDPDGVVDECVVAYVRELARHAEVYYLADCAMRPGELEKLAPYVKGAWAQRHGAYDFGSWSKLATELVGWKEIDRHDELVLVNDSCYLLRDLDGVFAEMDARRCDWWGLQATKGIAATRDKPSNAYCSPIPIERVKAELLPRFEQDDPYDFLVASYFLVYRRPVIADPEFRRLLSAVTLQPSKKLVIQKYEIGLSHLLIGKGYAFDTFIRDLHPFHPIFSVTHFTLVEQGFPLFKRFLLTENHYRALNLHTWKERLLSLVPDADVEAMERNLLRVADNEKLYRNLRITLDQEGFPEVPAPLDDTRVARLDRETPKFDHWWAFPVCAFDHTFAGNERAVFEEVKDDPSIKKIVLTRRKHIRVGGENVVVLPLRSAEGQYYLLRAKQIFVKHSPRVNVPYDLSPELHNFINLWHGIPIKRFGWASFDMTDKLDWLRGENARNRAVISSSKMDSLAMAAAFHPLSSREIWTTGLPRNDFILRAEQALPQDMQAELRRLRQEADGRRLLLLAPTFRNAQDAGVYAFGDDEIEFLADWCRRHNAVIGVREHMADTARGFSRQLASLGILDLSSARYPNIELLYRVADVLVSDYSSCMIDFMLTGKPIISFAYDHDHYANSERGLFYDMDFAVAGPVCRDFTRLAAALEEVFNEGVPEVYGYDWKRRMFFDHFDDHNAWRVVERVMALHAPGSGLRMQA